MIVIVDYGMGNLRSVEKAFHKLGAQVLVTNNPEDIREASAVVLPGVGAFRDCMDNLRRLSLDEAIVNAINQGKPYLGICLGLQILFEESEEFGTSKGLGVFGGKVVRFKPEKMQGENVSENINTPHTLKIPHMGWNVVNVKRKPAIFDSIGDGQYFYFVHSYYVAPKDEEIISGTTQYGVEFTSMVWKDNVFAIQFHPEKSQKVGLQLLENFCKLAY
ncbi:MAG: imidazole glycerol phosphate synthase subunit HisH [Nitrospirae bacterium]|nr:imidazole glycerol phosphate synthase subunit HisH [Nitrospirota bacterium]